MLHCPAHACFCLPFRICICMICPQGGSDEQAEAGTDQTVSHSLVGVSGAELALLEPSGSGKPSSLTSTTQRQRDRLRKVMVLHLEGCRDGNQQTLCTFGSECLDLTLQFCPWHTGSCSYSLQVLLWVMFPFESGNNGSFSLASFRAVRWKSGCASAPVPLPALLREPGRGDPGGL